MKRWLTWPGSVLGNLLAGLVTPVDADAEQAEDGPENDSEHDECGDEPRLVDQRRRLLGTGLVTWPHQHLQLTKATVDDRLRPPLPLARWWTRRNTVLVYRTTTTATWRTSSKYGVEFASGPPATRHENITLSTKPEARNVSKRRQRKTPEPWLWASCIPNLAKFGLLVVESC